jgi:hypothetical protein
LLLASNPLLLGVGSSALRLNLTEEERQATILSSVGSSHSMSMSDAHTDILTDIASSSDVQSTRNRTLLDPRISSSSALITNSAGSTFSNNGFDGVARSLSPPDDALTAENTSNSMSHGNVSSIAMAMEDCIEHDGVEINHVALASNASLSNTSRSRSGKIRSNVSAPAPQPVVGLTGSKGAKRGRPPAIAKQEQLSEDENSEAPQLPSPPRKNLRRSNSSNGGKQQFVEEAPAMKLVQASFSNTTTPVANRSRRGDRVDLLGISSIGSDFTDAPDDDAPMPPSSVDTETKESDVPQQQQQDNVPAPLTALKVNRRTVRSNVRPPNPAIATRRSSGAR